jgi:hypothetical protein
VEAVASALIFLKEPRGDRMTKSRVADAGRALCLLGAALGAIGLIGWLADLPSLTTIVPGSRR